MFRTRIALAPASLLAVGLLLRGEAAAVPLTLNGAVTNDGATFSIADLQGFASISVSVGPDTFTGVPLWTFLGGNDTGTTSNVTTNIPVPGSSPTPNTNPNVILRYAVLATGADGSQSLLSVGEFNPRFGGTGAEPNRNRRDAQQHPAVYADAGYPRGPLGQPEYRRPREPQEVSGTPAASNAPATQSTEFTLAAES